MKFLPHIPSNLHEIKTVFWPPYLLLDMDKLPFTTTGPTLSSETDVWMMLVRLFSCPHLFSLRTSCRHSSLSIFCSASLVADLASLQPLWSHLWSLPVQMVQSTSPAMLFSGSNRYDNRIEDLPERIKVCGPTESHIWCQNLVLFTPCPTVIEHNSSGTSWPCYAMRIS